MAHRGDEDWPPDAARIAAWLDGFSVARCRAALPPTEQELESRRERWRDLATVPLGFAAMVVLAIFDPDQWSIARCVVFPALLLYGVALKAMNRGGDAPGRVVVVRADAQGVSVCSGRRRQEARWAELVGIDQQEWRTALHLGTGAIVSLPRDKALDPVVRTARKVIAARAAYRQGLTARMEHGLSRPEDDGHAGRGLSLADGG